MYCLYRLIQRPFLSKVACFWQCFSASLNHIRNRLFLLFIRSFVSFLHCFFNFRLWFITLNNFSSNLNRGLYNLSFIWLLSLNNWSLFQQFITYWCDSSLIEVICCQGSLNNLRWFVWTLRCWVPSESFFINRLNLTQWNDSNPNIFLRFNFYSLGSWLFRFQRYDTFTSMICIFGLNPLSRIIQFKWILTFLSTQNGNGRCWWR